VLLDTSFLIDLMNGDDGAVQKARELETDLVQQRLSAMTRSERKPTPLGVGVSDSIAHQSMRYDSSGCSTASNPASIISR
jgi:hypothetical protein